MTATTTRYQDTTSAAELSTLRAEVATATRLVAPVWPVASFVATNPMRGLEHLPFDEACREARRWFGATTHCSLAWYRRRHVDGDITLADLRAAVIDVDPSSALAPLIVVGPRLVDPIDVVLADLLHGPELTVERPTDPWVESVVEHLGSWISAFLDDHSTMADPADRAAGLFAFWRRHATGDPRLGRLVGRRGRRAIGNLPDDATAALAIALDQLGVDDRVDALRALATRVPGWCGLALWMDEWAGQHRDAGRFRPVDVLAILAAIDAATGTSTLSRPPAEPADDRAILGERVDAVLRVLSADDSSSHAQRLIADLLRSATPRATVWLRAHEIHVRDELLTKLSRPVGVDDAGGAPSPDQVAPAAQLVACIDVRSERLRRRFEAAGDYETFGFAGFFGVPVQWRPFGSDLTEARCPVLVTPRHEATESPADPDAELGRRRRRHAGRSAWTTAKHDLAAPFALAESVGWWSGPAAMARTFAPQLAASGAARSRDGIDDTRDMATQPVADVVIDDPDRGLTLDEQVLFAEAIVTTIGMHRFAPLVLLAGHAASSVNNAHASSLHCGACGGAPGGANARIAAAILNDQDVRAALRGRDILIPDATWFVAAEHDTTTDVVRVLDRHLLPNELDARLRTVERDLRAAGGEAAAERMGRLPGGRADRRSVDWAETRPEWGLARNAAFVIGPRSTTAGVDLDGRVFLHSYEPDRDPDGLALETIMTAPLIVAQWISAQYYASSVDPVVFGAGDKLVHNPVEGFGVWRGQGGDLAIGLPWQSVASGGELEHEPVRLLAVVDAPVERVEAIVQRNAGLRELVEHQWLHLAARDRPGQPWSVRSPKGTWTTWHDAGAWGRPSDGESAREEV